MKHSHLDFNRPAPAEDSVLRQLWLAGILQWKLHETQLVIDRGIAGLPRSTKEAVLLCSRRFGKSYYGCVHQLVKGIQARKKKVLRIIGPDIKQTQMIVEYNMAKITEELHRLNLKKLVRYVKSEKMYYIGHHAGLFLGGFDSQHDSLRGGEAHDILIEETGSSDPDQYNYQMKSVIKPQLLKTRGRMVHLTTLPPLPDHPFITETIPQAEMDGALYSYTIYDDPLATPEIIADAIKDCGGEHTDAFRREYKNEIVRDRQIVIIPDFDAKLDIEDFPVPPWCRRELYTDWGGVRDKTVTLEMGYDFLRGMDVVFDELSWGPNTPTKTIVKDWKEKGWVEDPRLHEDQRRYKNHYIDCPGQLQVDLEQEHKITFQGVNKEDWESNVNTMANRFTIRKIKIHPRCKLLKQTCQSGTFNEQRTDFARSQPLGHMDAAAALMYGIRHLDRTSPFPVQSIPNQFHYTPPAQEQPVLIPQRGFTQKGIKRFGDK